MSVYFGLGPDTVYPKQRGVHCIQILNSVCCRKISGFWQRIELTAAYYFPPNIFKYVFLFSPLFFVENAYEVFFNFLFIF